MMPNTADEIFLLGGLAPDGFPNPTPADGALALTITVIDGVNPVQGARVALLGTGLLAATGTLGTAHFHVDAGNYSARVSSSAMYETPDDVTIEVTQDTTRTIELTPRVLPVGDEPGRALIHFFTEDFDGATPDSTITVKPEATGTLVVNGRFLSTREKIITPTSGHASVSVPLSSELEAAGASGIITAQVAGRWYKLRVPDDADGQNAAGMIVEE